jgi:hypothetical protein
MQDFGIYILTYPGDYHLSIALINSIKNFHPDVPIVIIPGEGFDLNDHPFTEPVMDLPKGFWAKMGHIDRKYWAFQGCFKRFLYLDADMICTRSFNSLIDRINGQDGSFIFVQEETGNGPAWIDAVTNKNHKQHAHHMAMVRGQLGNPEYIQLFDEQYDPYNRYPFNAGIFASSIETISESKFKDLYNKECEFYKTIIGKEFSWSAHDLFFADQGRINYLVAKLNIAVFNLFPDGHFLWGGTPAIVNIDSVLNGDVDFSFIHWAGCPRPSPSVFCKGLGLSLQRKVSSSSNLKEGYDALIEIPGYSVWEYFWTDSGKRKIKFQEKFAWSLKDADKVTTKAYQVLKKKVKNILR